MKDKANRLEKIYKKMEVELMEQTVEKMVVSDEKRYIKYAPSYQRNYVWTVEKATNLVETVLMDGIIPPLIALKKGKNIEIIDGRQRYETLLKFYNNEFKLKMSGLQKLKDWENKTYEELAPNLRTLFQEYKIKIIAYTIDNSIDVNDEDIDYIGRDLFRRYNYGMTPLKKSEIERATYYYDTLSNRFNLLFRKNEELYNKCIKLFLIDEKRKKEERERINLLLIIIRELITMPYIPIIGSKNIRFNAKTINNYYLKFIAGCAENEQSKKIIEFEKIFEKLYLIREKLIESNNSLKNNIQFFKSTYWMFSILYNCFSQKFYDFNIDKFCHYIQDDGKDYFDTYNGSSGEHLKKRNEYLKDYLEKELKLDINIYVEKIKENKKAIIYKKDTNISKDKDWYSPFLTHRLITRKETMELREIINHIKQDRFIVRPGYQRGEVFDKKKSF